MALPRLLLVSVRQIHSGQGTRGKTCIVTDHGQEGACLWCTRSHLVVAASALTSLQCRYKPECMIRNAQATPRHLGLTSFVWKHTNILSASKSCCSSRESREDERLSCRIQS